MLRKPYCAHWYPNEKKEVLTYFSPVSEKSASTVTCLVSPHAGWIYSGKVAGKCYSYLSQVDLAILLGTNHTGLGAATSLYPQGEWEMPMGTVGIASDFSDSLLKVCKDIQPDVDAHLYEHAIEVQIPFLQTLNPNVQIVPIEMRDYRLEVCHAIARSLSETIRSYLKLSPNHRICVIASSDMTHCGEQYGQIPPDRMTAAEFARVQDALAIEQMLQLDTAGLLETVKEKKITMCGSGPAAVVLETAKNLGNKKASLLGYATSSDRTGKDSGYAVGYAGLLIQ